MTITNGDARGLLSSNTEFLDHTKALEVLEKEYPERDGLDIETLLDSDKHGALTYNDFLILPGYIGAKRDENLCPGCLLIRPPRLSRVRCHPRDPRYEADLPEDTASIFSHGHRDGAQHGHSHGSARRPGCYPP